MPGPPPKPGPPPRLPSTHLLPQRQQRRHLGVKALPLLRHRRLQRRQPRLLRLTPLLQPHQPLLRRLGRLLGAAGLQKREA